LWSNGLPNISTYFKTPRLIAIFALSKTPGGDSLSNKVLANVANASGRLCRTIFQKATGIKPVRILANTNVWQIAPDKPASYY